MNAKIVAKVTKEIEETTLLVDYLLAGGLRKKFVLWTKTPLPLVQRYLVIYGALIAGSWASPLARKALASIRIDVVVA